VEERFAPAPFQHGHFVGRCNPCSLLTYQPNLWVNFTHGYPTIFEPNKLFFFLTRARANRRFLPVQQSSLARPTGVDLLCQIVDVE
jgi:hypothetical protein